MKRFVVLAFSLVLAVGGIPTALAQDAPKPPEFSAELTACLKTALGSAYTEISSGDREPTEAEFEKGEPCFEQFGPKQDPAQADPAKLNFAPGTEKCLKEKLGENFKAEFAGQKSKEQAKALRVKTKDCFGKNVAGNGPQELPAEVKSCIEGAVGAATAAEMFKGKPPAEGSESFEKVKKAGCFKNFGPPGDRGPGGPELPADKKACVEKIMGDLRAEPTEEQKQQIGKECFGGQGPGGQGGPQMPAEVQSCLSAAFGDQLEDLKKGPEFLTDEQKAKAEGCFSKHNFRPGGPGGGPGGPELPEDKRKCVEEVLGGDFKSKEPSEEQKRELGQKCFGGGGPGGPGGSGGGPGANLPPEKRECVEKILGSTGAEPNEEQKQQIGKECFGGAGGPGQGGPPPGEAGSPQGGVKNECADRITGGQGPTPEQQAKIAQECFGGQSQGQPPQGTAPTGSSGPPPGAQGAPPAGGQNACAERITGGQQPTDEQKAQIEKECFGR
ncbi:hypothetical protein HY374_00880 [Candidatus Berkelbacteria bacterium]|nr:hypothetical protein [Candidatus Berkelbacteria bacterium]